jgi:nucleoid-associated protein YgaU
VELLPFTKYQSQESDREIIWKTGNRLDLISYEYYQDTNYDWLILLANPDVPSLEFEIEEGTTLIIPYPLDQALDQFKYQLYEYNKYYTYQ